MSVDTKWNEKKWRVVKSLGLLARKQSKADVKVAAYIVSARGTRNDLDVVSLGYSGMPNGISFKDVPESVSGSVSESAPKRQKFMCDAVMNAIVSAGRQQADLTQCSVYCTPSQTDECKKMVFLSGIDECYDDDNLPPINEFIEVDLHKTSSKEIEVEATDEYTKGNPIETKSQKTSFFPLSMDDYFMTVAILSERCSDNESSAGSCIVSEEPPRVVSIGYDKVSVTTNDVKLHICAEICAISNAQRSRVDLTKCTLYTTYRPCPECTKVILQAGIRVVVWGKDRDDNIAKTEDMVYRAKARFIKYRCLIRIKDPEKKFVIDLRHNDDFVHTKKLKSTMNIGQVPAPLPLIGTAITPAKLTYREFFMAMAFLGSARSKNNKTQVGACIVTPYPHRLIVLSYNGMPNGRGFKDEEMDWGPDKEKYVCHAEPNAIISAYRRGADLSSCTMYVTHSPCDHCSKLIAQSGIKNMVFATEYHDVRDAYNHLERLPGMNVSHYKYVEGACGNIAKVVINLDELKTTLHKSTAEPESTQGIPKCQRHVDFPLDDYFMALAVLATIRSDCVPPVGACVVLQEPRRAISVGYNGLPDGRKDHSGIEDPKKYECCAESNAILSAFRYHTRLTGSILYTTCQPCSKCAQMIVQSGIETIVCGMTQDQDVHVDEIFFRAKIAILKYIPRTKKPFIVIDLKGLTTEQYVKVSSFEPLRDEQRVRQIKRARSW